MSTSKNPSRQIRNIERTGTGSNEAASARASAKGAPASSMASSVILVLLLWHAAVVLAGALLGPQLRAWGINSIGYVIDRPLTIVLAMLPVAYALFARTPRGQAMLRQPRVLPGLLAVVAVLFVAQTVWIPFRGGVPALLGDGSLYRSEVYRSVMVPGYVPTFFKPSAMLTGYVLKFIIDVQHSTVATQPFVFLSALALAIVVAAFIAVRYRTGLRDVLPLFAAFALSPVSLLLCGYVELYSLGFAAIVALLLLLTLRVQDGGHGVAVGVALAAALACTLAAGVFIPLAVALLWGARSNVTPQALRRGAAGLSMLLLAGIIGVYVVIGVSAETLYLLRLLPGPYVSEGVAYGAIDYVALSWIHTADMANLLFLIGGAWLPLLLLAGVHSRFRAMIPARTKFAVLVAVPVAVAFLLVSNTALGMSRDWDLAALPGLLLPFAGVLVYLAFSAQDRSGARLTLPLIVLMQFFAWYTWIDVNADRHIAVRRAADLVTLDAGHIRPDFSYYGFENIRKEYVTQTDWDGIFAQLLNMHGTGYHKIDTYDKMLRLCIESGKPRVIRPWIDHAARLVLADLEQQNLPANDYRRVDRRRLGEIATRLCLIAQNTGLGDRAAQLTNTFAGAFGAWKEEPLVRLCSRKESNADVALATVRASIDSTTGDAFLFLTAAIPLFDVGAWADAAMYLERSIEMNPTEYPAAYLSLAQALLHMRDVPRAERVLTACINTCNDPTIHQQAAQMLDQIRRTP